MERNITVKIGESLTIGGVTILVVERHGMSVKLGIQAPPEVHIRRAELEPKRRSDAPAQE